MSGRSVAIAGVGYTRQARRLEGRSSWSVVLEAVRAALADAGVEPNEVDGVAVDWPGPGGVAGESRTFARWFGPLRWTSDDALLDNAGARGVLKAAAAISYGLCDVAVVGGGLGDDAAITQGGPIAGGGIREFADCWGAYVVPHFALVAARHCHEYGTTPEQIACVAATLRNNGHTNPEAVMYGKGPYAVEDILASRMISTPLHLLEVCLVAQGGAAIVLTTLERARDLRSDPVLVLGGDMDYLGPDYLDPVLYREAGLIGRGATQRSLAAAGLGIGDVDVFSVYDPNAWEVIRQLEAFGLCEVGEGGAYVESGAIGLKGASPVNPDGGCLSYTWNGTQQMTLKVVEGVRQIRGSAVHQLEGVEVAVAANAGSGALHHEVVLLGRDRR